MTERLVSAIDSLSKRSEFEGHHENQSLYAKSRLYVCKRRHVQNNLRMETRGMGEKVI